jgi:ferredoxin
VGLIRRRKIPRDELMAVYFQRKTDPGLCMGCGACVDICPVASVRMVDGTAVVDEDWCIGCGVCVPKCDMNAIDICYREGKIPVVDDFKTLHHEIRDQRMAPEE